jgi:hypothetical protein
LTLRCFVPPFCWSAELDTGHPLYRLLYRELDTDQIFTLVGMPLDHGDSALQLDASTHAFLCLCAHVVYQVLLKPEPSRSADDGGSNSAADAVAAAADSSISRKKRKLESDVSFSLHALWEHFYSSAALPSQRLVSWLKFLYVFVGNYPSFLQLPSQGSLLSALVVGLLRSSERTKSEVKLWSLACLSRLASACHVNGIQLTQAPSSAFLLSIPSPQRAEVQKQYGELAANFAEVVDRLLKKLLFDERKAISRMALALLTKLATYHLIAPAQLAYLQTVFMELPALKQHATASTGGRLSNQIVELKKDLMSPQPKAPATPAAMRFGAVAVKVESFNAGSVAPLQSMLSSEVDLVTLRFIVAYLQRFELNDSSQLNPAPSASPHFASTSPHPSAMHFRAQLTSSAADQIGEEDLLRWILSYRFGSALFSPMQHTLRDQWSTSQWFASAVLAFNRLPLSSTQPTGVCLEEEFADDVKLPSPPSNFVHARQPQRTWLKADMGGVNLHQSPEMHEYFIQSQFVPLVSTETTSEEVALHQLPSICCEQHRSKSPHTINPSDLPLVSSSTARSTSLRLLTLSILSDQITSLSHSLSERTSNRVDVMMDTTDHHGDFEEKKPSAAIKVEDVCFAMRFYLHYLHILCSLALGDRATEEPAAANESRLIILNLVSTCWKQLALLMPHLTNRVDSPAAAHLLAYSHHLLAHFQRVFCVQLPGGETRCDVALQQSIAAFEASSFKVLLHVLHDAKSAINDGRGKRRLEFDGHGSSASLAASFTSSLDASSVTDSVCNSLISIIVQLLSWKVLAPVNTLAELKQFLDTHMGGKLTVNDCSYFYRLAHVHALAKFASNTPNPNHDLLYYLAYLSEEFFARPPAGSPLALINRDLLHFRALGFFLDLAQSIRKNWIVLDEAVEEKRVQKVFEDLFGNLNTWSASSLLSGEYLRVCSRASSLTRRVALLS